MDDELCGWSARRLVTAMRTRELSAVEVLTAHLERIDRINPQLNAIVSMVPEQALAQARKADQATVNGEPAGLLQGLPIAVKDLMDTAGITTTYGSRIYLDHVPQRDALIVTRLKAAGAIVVGKTNTPEFGAGSHTFNEVFGTTRNPYDPSRSAGGSSGGAAAALAAGLLPIADGSDLGGSVRNPASFCNVVGLRPSAGRVGSTKPGDAWDPSSLLGPMARNCGDAALLLAAIAGPDPRAPLSIDEPGEVFLDVGDFSFAGARVAVSRTVGGLPIDPAVAVVMDEVVARLGALGAEVTEVEPDLTGADLVFETLRSLEFLAGHGEDARTHPDLVKRTVREDVSWGSALSVDQLIAAQSARTELFRRMQAFLTDYDVLIAPTVQLPPFDGTWEYPREVAGVPMERYYTWQRSCSRLTATTLPVLAVPAGFTADGLPVGIQLVGRHRGERRLLAAGMAWERAVPEVVSRRPVLR
jgi:amidase